MFLPNAALLLPQSVQAQETKERLLPPLFQLNTPDYQDHVGPLPDKTYYDPQGMSVEGAQEFERWYTQHDPDYVFDFLKELVAYCESAAAQRGLPSLLSRIGRDQQFQSPRTFHFNRLFLQSLLPHQTHA